MTTPSENHEPYGRDRDDFGSTYGTEPYGSTDFGGQGYTSPRYGQQPFADQPFHDQPYGAQQFGAQQFGAQPYGMPSYGDQPYGAQHFGVQPYGAPGAGAVHPYATNYGASRKEPALSLVLSFFLPGLGTIINGQAGKGIGIMAGYFLGILLSVVLIGIPIMLGFWVWGMVDAYSGAKQHNLENGFY
ncbi:MULTISPECIES: hypothetical protein [unclassified Dietzia]|uniref:hypothetical protein n=1 Tax=unclassified Dietzia TaxID=2617939 RepID=UPI0018D22B7F|nr:MULTISPECIES: hypothetical protein [unclassified Dietzia]